jgi:hypothetical protein
VTSKQSSLPLIPWVCGFNVAHFRILRADPFWNRTLHPGHPSQ